MREKSSVEKSELSGETSQSTQDLVVFSTDDGNLTIDVRIEDETVWLTAEQVATLFDRDKKTIYKHINNIYRSGELDREETSRTEKQVGGNSRSYDVEYYDLDAIISIGYRVKSAKGVKFRRWATRTLRDHLVKGYTLNERRLSEERVKELEDTIALMRHTLLAHQLETDEAEAMLGVITKYARSWRLLLQYDEDRLPEAPPQSLDEMVELEVDEAREAIAQLKKELMNKGEASDLFGRERGHGLEAILGTIEQSFGGEALYPSVASRAAHLFYFIIKDHPFSDGNKRIGSFMFVRYLEINGSLQKKDGSDRFDPNALVALALLVAESDPSQKELIVKLVLNLMADDDQG